MENNWQKIWDNRKNDIIGSDMENEEELILGLKKMVGWDFCGKGSNIAFEEFLKEYEYLRDNLKTGGGTVFEVGCGNGANLYFFHKDGFKIGGLDYSPNLLAVAKKVIGEENFIEAIVGDASELPTEIKYDAVFSFSVFQYFSSIEYAEKVLDRMLAKATKSICVTEILNEEKREDYFKYRRATVKNFDEKYKDLPKLFIPKKFFTDYAEKNNLDVEFPHHHIEGFWNNEFNFDCFMYKKI